MAKPQTTAHNGPLHQPGGDHATVAENGMGMKIIKSLILHGYSPLKILTQRRKGAKLKDMVNNIIS
jgi:hypothetical protein